MNAEEREPRYVISIVARMLDTPTYTLRYYERIGLVKPARSRGNIRLYSEEDITHLRRVKTLVEELGVNPAGVEVVMHMAQRITLMQQRVDKLESQLAKLRRDRF